MSFTRTMLILTSLFLLLPMTGSAATLSISVTPAQIGVGDEMLVTVLLDSAIPTNAFSGTLVIPPDILETIGVVDGNSIINMWITRPTVSSDTGTIAFAGITPGGFSGNDGTLFSVLVRAKMSGTARLSLKDSVLLRNDGEGGEELVVAQPYTISVKNTALGGYIEPEDVTAPEPFTAHQGVDPELFDGQAYLAFTAVDKGSGIDQYVLTETRLPAFLLQFFPLRWATVSSPYVLGDQHLTSTIYIKALDRAGNERLSVFPPQHLLTVYEKYLVVGILLIVVLLWQIGWGRRFGKNL